MLARGLLEKRKIRGDSSDDCRGSMAFLIRWPEYRMLTQALQRDD